MCDLLKRHDLIPTTRRRPRLSHPGRPLTPMTEPNRIWTADFKGQFKTRDGVYCYPLTLVDGYSRYLLACQGLRSTAIVLARPIFRRAFEEYGLPDRLGCRPRVKPSSGCSPRRKGDLRGAPHANDRRSRLAANAGIPRTESRVDVRKNQRRRGMSMVQARVGLAATCVVRCGRLQRTLKDGQADRRGNCRGVNRLESGTSSDD